MIHEQGIQIHISKRKIHQLLDLEHFFEFVTRICAPQSSKYYFINLFIHRRNILAAYKDRWCFGTRVDKDGKLSDEFHWTTYGEAAERVLNFVSFSSNILDFIF